MKLLGKKVQIVFCKGAAATSKDLSNLNVHWPNIIWLSQVCVVFLNDMVHLLNSAELTEYEMQ